MRILIERVINELDHKILPTMANHNFIVDTTNPTILKIIESLRKYFLFTIKPESFWRISSTPNGHPWHVDTGDNNHMMWCQVGCSILLTSPHHDFTGGDTIYNKENPVVVIRDKYDMIAHNSDEWHMINAHTGCRVVLLLFI